MFAPDSSAPDPAVTARSKIARRILPFVSILYIISYLDRANVAFAKLSLAADLKFSEAVFGFGAGIFFLGYMLLEIPGALIVERWSARKWIARILISWGLCTVLVGFVRTPAQFYWARFLLGVSEAGFFPGIIVYLTHWFSKEDRARAMSGFILGVPLSLAIGAPISAAILRLNWLGMPGWRWMFILEGLPAIIFGVITLCYLTDHPSQARWLSPAERDWITNQLAREKKEKEVAGRVSIWEAFRDRNVFLLCASLFFAVIGVYGFLFWLPSTIKTVSGLGTIDATLWSTLPLAAGLIGVLVSGWSSDRRQERRFHAALALGFVGVFFWLSARPGQSFPMVMFWLCLAGAFCYGWGPPFWSLPTLILGEAAAAASVGLINSLGNLGGFLGPSLMGWLLTKGYPSSSVNAVVACSFLMAALLVSWVREKRGGYG